MLKAYLSVSRDHFSYLLQGFTLQYYCTVYWGVLLHFLMTPEAIDKATVAQVSNRWVPVLEKQQVVHQSPLMKLWISRPITNMAWGCLEPITAGSLGREESPVQFATPGRRGEVPHPRQQPGPCRPLLKTCIRPRGQWDWKKMTKEQSCEGWRAELGWYYWLQYIIMVMAVLVFLDWNQKWCIQHFSMSSVLPLKRHLDCYETLKHSPETQYTTETTSTTSTASITTVTTSAKSSQRDTVLFQVNIFPCESELYIHLILTLWN